MRKDLLGAAAACLSSCLGGASVVATRAVVGQLESATLAALRYGLGALCLLLLVFALRHKWPERRDLLPIVLLGMLFFTGFPYLFNLSLSYTTAARGSLALSTLPFLTLLVAAALRRERITSGKLAGVVAAICGVVIALGDRVADDAALRMGDLLMVATALCGAFYNVLSRPYLARTPALTYTTTGMIAGAGASTLWALAVGAPERIFELPAWAWSAVAFLGVGGAAFTFFLWSYGLEHTTPTVVATTVTLNPVVAIVLGNLMLGEPVPGRLALGILAILAGLALVSGRGVPWVERLARLQRRRYEARLLSRLDTRTLRDVGLLGRVPRDRHRLARPFWWLPTDPAERRRG
ncbi:MAG TPA: EamA family transporter [Alphaproteobacteria bacterium]|nr:EamA family transporter [Alphaproteobacteria bacterium]